MSNLTDQSARTEALTTFDRTILLEAGAGSGKTAVMAGRVTLMLAAGIAASEIVAITFTEPAASELVVRIRAYVAELSAGRVPLQLAAALPTGLSATQLSTLHSAESRLDDLTCTTIHGFCQRLIRPYPVETDMDPGARLLDPVEAKLLLQESIDDWLREHLGGQSEGYLVELVRHDPKHAVRETNEIAKKHSEYRNLQPPAVPQSGAVVLPFTEAAKAYLARMRTSVVSVPEAEEVATALLELLHLVDLEDPAKLIALLSLERNALLTEGRFKQFRFKGKFEDAAAAHGVSKAQANEEFETIKGAYDAAAAEWLKVRAVCASVVLAGLMREAGEAAKRYERLKRRSALLDFDDLLHAARDLLADHETIRRALSDRYRYVLVDEFQDTDPLQAEILWRLCGSENPAAPHDWTKRALRPGSLFLVGDPKQAVYRFRGADVETYLQARDALVAVDATAVQSISMNFRSRSGVLQFVNGCFEEALTVDGQPGFTPLDTGRADAAPGSAVALLPIKVNEDPDAPDPSSEEIRLAEADAVAELCSNLLSRHEVPDGRGGTRPVEPRDIALLAPTGTELHIYEAALESRGIPVASQAGKSFWKRQEVQDLVALTRLLADSRDRLALLAFLRGPLIGLTDEEILDIEWSLRQKEQAAEQTVEEAPGTDEAASQAVRTVHLSMNTDPELIDHALASDTLRRLQSLRRRANQTTPHHLLSQAVDQLRVRPVLKQRHHKPERALANVAAFLELAKPYSIRGLQAFALNVTTSWDDDERAVEGRADKDEDVLTLVTMHSAKGLEWPIVIPVNTSSGLKSAESSFVDRSQNTLYRKVLGAEPLGFSEASEREERQSHFERQRLWYVATTRARELLVLPKVRLKSKRARWNTIVPLFEQAAEAFSLAIPAGLTRVELGQAPNTTSGGGPQSRTQFIAEGAAIEAATIKRKWSAASRAEVTTESDSEATAEDRQELLELIVEGREALTSPPPQGGRHRGTIMHKLFEEVLTGELDERQAEIAARAEELVRSLGFVPSEDATSGLAPAELANCVIQALALPEVASLRAGLEPELPVYSLRTSDGVEQVTTGVADAVQWSEDGRPLVVIDWKTDVNPRPSTIEKYKGQVKEYLRATGAQEGLLVFVTVGRVVGVGVGGDRGMD